MKRTKLRDNFFKIRREKKIEKKIQQAKKLLCIITNKSKAKLF